MTAMSEGTEMSRLETVIDGFIATVRLNHPPVNAIDREMIDEFEKTLAVLEANRDVRVVVVTGARVFSAGVDIKLLRNAAPGDAVPRNARFQAVYQQIDEHRLPVIAAIEGYALGGGCELAMACDIRIAGEDTLFALPEIGLGGLPGIGGMTRARRLVGEGKAKQLVLSGERISATEALRIRLIEELTPTGGAYERALEIATAIAGRPPLSVQAGKRALNSGRDQSLLASQEIDLRYCGEIAGTEDRGESLAAFLEKRAPVIVGR